MNDEGWWFQAVEGFWFMTDRQTDKRTFVIVESLSRLKMNLKGDLSLTLFINYNEDKQMALENHETEEDDDVDSIIIDTIGNISKGKGNQ